MRASTVAVCLAFSVSLAAAGCGSNYSSSSSPSPTPGPSTPPPAGTVDITGISGNKSFNPNPGTMASDNTVMFQNNDGSTHRIVANDGSFDSGAIAPGAGSPKLAVAAAGTNFHCTIHPSMIGSIKGTSGSAPPCQGQYCSQASAQANH